MEVNGAHEEPSVTDGQLRGEGGAGTSPSARGEVPAASAGGTAAEDGISGPHTARPTEPPPPPPRPPPEAEAAVKSEPREEETESPRPRGEVTVKQDTSSTNGEAFSRATCVCADCSLSSSDPHGFTCRVSRVAPADSKH
jgi:hypothetical protein